MKANLSNPLNSNAKNLGSDRETTSQLIGLASVEGKIKELVNVRFYMGRSKGSSVVYCSVWVHGGNRYGGGHSQAGGYGYHKASSALQGALTSAGVFLVDEKTGHPVPIDGRGDAIMEEAVKAIMLALEPTATDYLVSRG